LLAVNVPVLDGLYSNHFVTSPLYRNSKIFASWVGEVVLLSACERIPSMETAAALERALGICENPLSSQHRATEARGVSGIGLIFIPSNKSIPGRSQRRAPNVNTHFRGIPMTVNFIELQN
jgi:hypothetical protein